MLSGSSVLTRKRVASDSHGRPVCGPSCCPTHPRSCGPGFARRRELGQDGFDEVWEGVYHVAPMCHGRHGRTELILARVLGPRADEAGLSGSGRLNIGGPDDYRVPDQAYLRDPETALWNPTAAVVVEIISPR